MPATRSARNEAAVRWSRDWGGERSPASPKLSQIAAHLADTGWAAALLDAEWNLTWVSDQLRLFMGGADDEALGVGRHFCAALKSDRWRTSITEESRRRWLRQSAPYVAHDTPGGVAGLRELVHADDRGLLDGLAACAPPPLWGWTIDVVQEEGVAPATARCLAVRHETPEGLLGTSLVYGADLPASLLALLARGDSGMYSRMARLVEPARRSAAILFVDVCSSARLSRRLPTATYFRLIQAIMTAVDDVLARHRGVIGKHVGDGATGFFLSEDFASESATARAAVEAATEVVATARQAAAHVEEDAPAVSGEQLAVRVGLHWGWSLFMGQVVRGGRLEVSALGDEVNECARIEESAPDGAVLASKALIERLGRDDAAEVGLDPKSIRYAALGDLPGAGDKARRDAGGLAVADLFGDSAAPDIAGRPIGRSGAGEPEATTDPPSDAT